LGIVGDEASVFGLAFVGTVVTFDAISVLVDAAESGVVPDSLASAAPSRPTMAERTDCDTLPS
jgi:hypothetical protein